MNREQDHHLYSMKKRLNMKQNERDGGEWVIIGMIQVDIPGLQKVLCWTTFNWLGVEDVEVLVVVFLTAVGVAK